MSGVVRWAVIVVAALVVVGLLTWARGPAHHRGDEVGSSWAPGPSITGR